MNGLSQRINSIPATPPDLNYSPLEDGGLDTMSVSDELDTLKIEVDASLQTDEDLYYNARRGVPDISLNFRGVEEREARVPILDHQGNLKPEYIGQDVVVNTSSGYLRVRNSLGEVIDHLDKDSIVSLSTDSFRREGHTLVNVEYRDSEGSLQTDGYVAGGLLAAITSPVLTAEPPAVSENDNEENYSQADAA